MKFTIVNSSWGAFGIVSDGARLRATFLPRPEVQIRRLIDARWPDAVEMPRALPGLQKRIKAYFDGKAVEFDVDLDLSDIPPFWGRVLQECRRVGYGRTVSYADLARAAGSPNAGRAVGGAMSHNPLPLIVPCHRVLRADGSIGGFSSTGGTDEKSRMLALEGVRIAVGGRRKAG